MEIKLAEEILDSNLQTIADNYDMSQDEFNIVIRAMKEYAAQFIELAAEQAEITDSCTNWNCQGESVNKESILKIKEQIK